ncbi:MAG: hypothetical protein LBC11_00900, partial [Puniceicoccales bacterium]|nr:hypothetical protein [Puniceicoccales bacterium]
ETELQKLTSEQQKANQALEQAQRQIQQREQEIEHLNREHQTILQNNTKEIQTLTVEIETKRQSLGELTKEKGTLEENLRNVEARCSEFREKVQSFTSSNETLQAQFLSQGRLVEQQKETIDTQRRALTAAQEAIDSLRNQTQGGRGFLQTFVQTAGVVAGGMLGIAVTRAL